MFTPTPVAPVTPVWKLPLAIGMRSPISRRAFCPSEARNCGLFRIFVLVSFMTAWSNPPGKVVAQSAVESRGRLLKGTKLFSALAPVPIVVPIPARGLKTEVIFKPVVPAAFAMVAAISLVRAEFTCMTMTSITTSDLGLSKSRTNFSANATRVHVAANNDRFLSYVGVYTTNISDGADGGLNFVEFLSTGRIGDVNGLRDLIGEIATIGGAFIGNEDGGSRQRLPRRCESRLR